MRYVWVLDGEEKENTHIIYISPEVIFYQWVFLKVDVYIICDIIRDKINV